MLASLVSSYITIGLFVLSGLSFLIYLVYELGLSFSVVAFGVAGFVLGMMAIFVVKVIYIYYLLADENNRNKSGSKKGKGRNR